MDHCWRHPVFNEGCPQCHRAKQQALESVEDSTGFSSDDSSVAMGIAEQAMIDAALDSTTTTIDTPSSDSASGFDSGSFSGGDSGGGGAGGDW